MFLYGSSKIGTGKPDIETMYGQQVERCQYVLDSCDERQIVVAVNITVNTLGILTAERLPANDVRLSTTGRQISKDSPGFQLLVQLPLTPKADLGFALTPTIESLGGHASKCSTLSIKARLWQLDVSINECRWGCHFEVEPTFARGAQAFCHSAY